MSVDINLLSTDAQHVFEAAMKLSPGERARLADKLSLTIDPLASSEWRQAWGPEIARRVAEVEDGSAKLLDWKDVRQRLWEGLDVPPSS